MYVSDDVVIGFEREMYSVEENAGEVEVCATVTEGDVGRPVTVVLESQPGTATGGESNSGEMMT